MADRDDRFDDEVEEETIAKDIVVTKYKMAADIVNDALKKLVEKCEVNAKVQDLCEFGDKLLADETFKVFKKEKEMKKGIAFPTCISINNCICHFSPLKGDSDVLLKEGDLVKIDIGAHIDGFVAVAAHSHIVGASTENKVTGRKADVMLAAHVASEIALRLVKPGNENVLVTEMVQKAASNYKCKPVEGMLSHQLQKHIIDGKKTIMQNPSDALRKDYEKCEFEVYEVYGIDVIISTGEGKGRDMDVRTTVYKKREGIYNLKMKASRQFFSEAEKKFGNMPFALRSFDDENKAKMGVLECVKHQLVEPFTVMFERENELVAQFKFTVLLMPNGPLKITGLPFDSALYESDCIIRDEEIKNMLAASASRKTAKKKKKKAEKSAANGLEEPAEI